MPRDIQQLKSGPFDVLVIGGGIYGSWIAYQASVSGLKVALVDQSDWGCATSSASSKLLHGGLRYLERFEIGMVRKSLQERRELNRLLPHHVRPLKFLLPVYRHSRVGRFRLKLGLWLYDRLAGRNQPVEPHRRYSATDLLQQESSLSSEQLLGGFSYGDCGTDDFRMILEIVDSAISAGAVACNYVSAEKLLTSNGRITGASLFDAESRESFPVNASLVVNAAGPWVNRLSTNNDTGAGTTASEVPVRLTKGVHLVMPALSSGNAVLLTARSDGRVFFLIPWYGRTLLGTTDTDYHGNPADVCVEQSDVDYLLSAANHYLKTPWTSDDIHAGFAGLRTLQDEQGKSASGVSREWLFQETQPGLMSSIGGKYTSARIDAIHAVEDVIGVIGRGNLPAEPHRMAWCSTLAFGEFQKKAIADLEAVGVDPDVAQNCVRRYGTQIAKLADLVQADARLTERIVAELPFCYAEVVHAVVSESAKTLLDVLRRRVPLAILTRLDTPTITSVCELVSDYLEWDQARQKHEILSVQQACWPQGSQ